MPAILGALELAGLGLVIGGLVYLGIGGWVTLVGLVLLVLTFNGPERE